jgi:putative transposase
LWKGDIKEERSGKYNLCIKVVLWWKKAMPRQARLDAPGILHHVMIRGIKGKEILQDTQDPKDFVTRTRILAWPLLGNHVHGF